MEIIHIAGFSCVGKRSLILKLCDPRQVDLKARFGIHGSIERFWSKPQFDEVFDDTPWRSIEELDIATADHMLHKWQWPTRGKVFEWQRLRPDVPHRAIVLWRPLIELQQRICEKGMWHPEIEDVKHHSLCIPQAVDELREASIPVEFVDARTPLYDRLPELPED